MITAVHIEHIQHAHLLLDCNSMQEVSYIPYKMTLLNPYIHTYTPVIISIYMYISRESSVICIRASLDSIKPIDKSRRGP